MAINRNYTDKEEWQRGYDVGREGVVKSLDASTYSSKQELYVASRLFNKEMAEEHVKKDRKSDDFLAGMETAIQEELEKRWDTVQAAQPTITMNAGWIPGLFGVNFPVGTPQEALQRIEKTGIKILKNTTEKPITKKSRNNTPVNLTITPGAMDEAAKGQYEFCDQFCDYVEKMGLGAMLGKDGVKELREFNDQKMKEYDPEYLKKKEETRTNTEQEPEKPTRRRFEL